MAVFTFGNALPQFTQLQDMYDDASLKLKSHTATKAVYEDKNGDSIILIGTGLHYKGNAITAGTVKSVEFEGADNAVLLSVTKASYNAKTVASALATDPNVFDFMGALSAGNDTIHGSNTVEDNMGVGLNHGNDTFIYGKDGGFAGAHRATTPTRAALASTR